MRGVQILQSPCSFQAYRPCPFGGVNVEASRTNFSNFAENVAGSRAVNADLSLGACQFRANIKPYSSLNCFGFQQYRLRQSNATRNFQLGFRKYNLIREEKKSFLTIRCDSSDHESASTTTSSNAEEQQKIVSPDSTVSDAVEQGLAIKNGLSALDAYFNKLKGSSTGGIELSNSPVSTSSSVSAVSVLAPPEVAQRVSDGGATSNGKDAQGLKALDAYFEKLNPKKPDPVIDEVKTELEKPEKPEDLTEEELFLKTLLEAKEEYDKYKASARSSDVKFKGDLKVEATTRVDEDGNELDLSDWELDEEQVTSSDLINVLVAINIAVYLFGLASPHEAFGITDSSLPFVYGAKVNDLIVAGQWWRLITPMFLHASLLHVGLGSWALLSFGPAVESAYGTLGFAMIYFLGGIFGDLMSFYHTTEWTVGGTGPIYALVGTWLVYLLKNRETIGKEIADDMIRKVIILSALNVALWNSLPVDDWTHLGAILVGILFGLLASPTMQLNLSLKELDPDSKEEMGEAFLWFNDGLSPARLTLVFVMFLGIFYCLYQVGITGSPDFYLLQDRDIFS
ncbi:hypothetical protein MPTK2_1g24540 [Marchantia polymorpha subsp. ruderalis]